MILAEISAKLFLYTPQVWSLALTAEGKLAAQFSAIYTRANAAVLIGSVLRNYSKQEEFVKRREALFFDTISALSYS